MNDLTNESSNQCNECGVASGADHDEWCVIEKLRARLTYVSEALRATRVSCEELEVSRNLAVEQHECTLRVLAGAKRLIDELESTPIEARADRALRAECARLRAETWSLGTAAEEAEQRATAAEARAERLDRIASAATRLLIHVGCVNDEDFACCTPEGDTPRDEWCPACELDALLTTPAEQRGSGVDRG